MSLASSLTEIPSSSQTSAVSSRRSLRAESISIPASVTRRAKRSGRITVSALPFERLRRSASSTAGLATGFAVSKSLEWRLRSSSRRSSASAASSGGSSTAAFWRQPSSQATSWREEEKSVSKTEPLPRLPSPLRAGSISPYSP